jgi:hypothetical protein
MPAIARRVRIVHVTSLAWLAAFAWFTARDGVPTTRTNVLAWMLLAAIALGIHAPRRCLRSLVLDWSPIVVALVAYDQLRGMSDDAVTTAHAWPQLAVDEWLGRGQALSARAQDVLYHPGIARWYDYPAWLIYVSHFIAPLAVAVVLGACGSPRFRRYLYGVAVLSWLALLTYWLYPAQPPWMTAQLANNAPVDRVMHGMWTHIGVERAARVWAPGMEARGSSFANPVAALPSLHAAFPALMLLMLRGIRPWLTLLVGASLVYAGEHFAFDIAMGWAYAAGAAWLVMFVPALARRLRPARRVAVGARVPVRG